ncbi:GEVED domain-containing protein [Chryseobacterium scophthalmum]|uniref:GEVED domain-containing protein n=1 Tax=Chryseobacterium scophthalmum TaxID=59733 RepID=UPI00398A80A5
MGKILFTCMMLLGIMSSAQISYTYGWEPTGDGSWTSSGSGSFSRSTTTPCSGTAAMRANNYYNASSYLVSPALTGTNGGDLNVSFAYKVTEYSSNGTGASLADLGVIKLNWATSATGPWTTAYTIDNTNHVVSASCATKTATITGLPASGNLFIRFEAKSGLDTSDNYVYFDDINITQGAAPSCPSPGSVVLSSFTANSASVSWAAPATAPANGYQVYYSTTNTAPTASTVLNATNSVSSATTSANIPGLASNTAYYVWVRSSCSTTDKSIWIGPVNVYTGYCLPSTTNQDSWVSDFTSTGAATNMAYSSTAGGAGGYQNLTATNKISNYAGSVTPISLTAGGPTVGFAVWVDWNNNLTFEASESVYATTSYVTSTSGATITVPAGTALGNYRMRVVTNYNNSAPSNPCEAFARGEYIDFTFEVTAVPSCLVPATVTSSAVTSNSATISWTAPTPAPANGYEYYYSTTNSTPNSGTVITATSQPLTLLAPLTTYYYWVRSVCSSSSVSTWATGSFTTLATPPANDACSSAIALTPGLNFAQNPLTGTTAGSTNTPALTASCLFTPTNVGGNVWYTVVVPASGSLTIETAAVTGSPLTDTVLSVFSGCSSTTSIGCDDDSGTDAFSKLSLTGQTPGATLYVSVWKYSTATDGAFQISAYDASLSTSESVKAKNDVKVYPNPFADVLNISDVSNVKSISVMDIAGRLVKSFDKPESTLHLRGLNSGMYLVVLNMKDGSKQTIKAIKK